MKRRDEKIIEALILAPTIAQAAELAGASVRTVYRRLADPAFKEALAAAKGRVVDHAVTHLQTIMGEATAALRAALSSPQEKNRIAAARVLVAAGLRSRDADLFDAIEQLRRDVE